ncbi:M23 family metallopeptidase [Hazenella coriacea]|uniref:Mannosyl-glycoprotein endo-beta-N-acetylglucosaminidase n=1 Tax=Hazenella coriacea TaxID=1179467 RepID=A0A4R3L5D5_9BACL|nr:peptidoglycan DD-metalloendopeptidase family protein [Hazenella coriacea]TCS94849.1 mannosyl-glycoprotein endo-beta-N-acetylglucosaminidase [Hazenella coriacea]
MKFLGAALTTLISMFGKEILKYSFYGLIAFLFLMFVALLGAPPEEESEIPPDGVAFNGGTITCRPTGNVITVQELDEKLKGKGVFDGKADVFINTGKKYGVDPVLIVAIALQETKNGTSPMVRKKNNPGGLYSSTKKAFMEFDTLDQGIDYMAMTLYNKWISKGLKTPDLIGEGIPPLIPGYAPTRGATNDPNLMNLSWRPGVKHFINYLGGLSYECTVEEIKNIGPISSSGFLRPLDKKYRVTSYFGPRWGKPHEGLDYGCPVGTPIVASKSGVVEVSKFGYPGSGFGGYGNVVLVNHGGGVKTLYAHLASQSVRVGQTVSQGQQIGLCGSTGRSTGPHLHFEIRTSKGKVNPLKYVGR